MHLRRDAGIVVVAALFIGVAPGVSRAQSPADSYYNFLMGRHLEMDGNVAGALAALDRAAAADPRSAEVRAEIASLQLRRNMRDEAEKAAKAALALDANNAEANSVLGRLYANAAANEKNTRTQTETYVRDSIRHLERATAGASGPPDPTLNYTLGRMYTASGQPQKGIEALERVIAQSPFSVQARLALAQAYASANDFAGAIETLDPVADDSPVALEEMAKYQMGAGRNKEAVATYTRGLQGQPNNRRLKVQRIIAAYEDKQYQQAATYAAEAQRQHQDDPNFPRLQASALMKAGETPRAIALLETSARTFPRDGEIQFMLASLYKEAGRDADSERMLRQMLNADPANHRVLNYLGYLLAQDGRELDEAIRLVQRALQAEPGRAEYLDSLGWAHFKRGDFAEAEKYLTEAARKLPDHPEILDHLGDLYASRGRWQDAIAAWTRALEGGEDGIEPAVVRKKIDDARSRVAR
jgi:tetratricopeptide (TPR) repeat protein